MLEPSDSAKQRVRLFWEAAPCGTRDLQGVASSDRAYFQGLERMRLEREPFIASFARFSETRGKKVLEVGIGAGTDFVQFARSGADAYGVDFTAASVDLVRRRLRCEQLVATVLQADAEVLPFASNSFDVVYSWGVIHHTPNTPRAAREMIRVLRPGGRLCVMVYHRRSLLALQAYFRFGILGLRPWRSLDDILAAHVESPGTKAYTQAGASALFEKSLDCARVTPIVTPYDVRIGRRRFLPAWVRLCVPARFGWFLVVEGTKTALSSAHLPVRTASGDRGFD